MLKEFFKILEFVAAVILSAILLPAGLFFNIWELVRFKKRFFVFFIRFLYEIILISLDIFEKIAVIIDRIGNIILGNAFTYFLIKKEFRRHLSFNPYGLNHWTISASTGYFESRNMLNKRGERFSNLLSKILGKDHCLQAYEFQILKDSFNSKTGIS